MTTESSNSSSADALLALAGITFVFFGVTGNPLLLSGALACIGIMLARRPSQRRLGIAVSVLAVVYFIAVFGYGVGKDMSVRDNARAASKVPVESAIGDG